MFNVAAVEGYVRDRRRVGRPVLRPATRKVHVVHVRHAPKFKKIIAQQPIAFSFQKFMAIEYKLFQMH